MNEKRRAEIIALASRVQGRTPPDWADVDDKEWIESAERLADLVISELEDPINPSDLIAPRSYSVR